MNFSIFPNEETTKYIKIIKSTSKNLNYVEINDLKNNDFLFIFGGDGTFLKSLHQYIDKKLKLILVNTGRVGFLSSINKKNFTNLDINEFEFSNFYFLEISCGKNIFVAINEISIELDILSKFNSYINSNKLMEHLCSKVIFINYLGTTGLARTYRYPIILRNQPSYIFDVLDSPQYSYNRNLNQPIIFSNKDELELSFNNKLKTIIKCDNVKYYLSCNRLKVQMKKSKCKIMNIDNLDNFINKLTSLFK